MHNLMELLFAYAQENLIESYLSRSMEPVYKSSRLYVEKQEAHLRGVLNQEDAAHLDTLLEEQTILEVAQMRAAFQAGFRMAMELAR